MGKTYEALRQAELERSRRLTTPKSRPSPARQTQPPRMTPSRPNIPRWQMLPKAHWATEPYDSLKTNLFTRYPQGTIKSVLFSGTSPGDGCSTTAVHFAGALAKDPQLKVLVVEVNMRTPRLHKTLRTNRVCSLKKLLEGNASTSIQIAKVRPWNFYALAGENSCEPLQLLESKRFARFLDMVRRNFDYVIMDGPPVPFFSEFRVLCSRVDGVVMVVDSGRTRQQVALRAKQQLEEAGARLLGVVLNRRKYYIPERIYKRL